MLRLVIDVNVKRPLVGQTIYFEVFASAPVASIPVVRVSGVRRTTFVAETSPQSWRYAYTPILTDTGRVDAVAKAPDGSDAQLVVHRLFTLKFDGAPDMPFGQFPFGLGNFAINEAFQTVPPSAQDPLAEPLAFRLRRGQEGPQIVATWSNPTEANVKLLRRELQYPVGPADTVADVVYTGTGASHADLAVVDGRVYYYMLAVETATNVFTEFGRAHILAIDTQPYTDFTIIPNVKSRTTAVQPVAAPGDRYVLPVTATGAAWTGNGGKVATWTGSIWTFETPQDRWTAFVTDEETLVTYRLGVWIEVVDKERLDLYAYLTGYDRKMDLRSAHAALIPAVATDLDGENFNFDLDPTKGRPTLLRFLRTFNLALNEVKGLLDYMVELYHLRTVDEALMLHAAALIGYDDYVQLPPELRRFIVQQLPAQFPKVGSDDAVNLAIQMWLGSGVLFRLKRYGDNVFIANESACPVVTPSEDPNNGTIDESLDTCLSVEWASLAHYRALGIFLDHPFDPATFIPQDAVQSVALNAPPMGPVTGARYVVAVNATGAWTGQDFMIATWDGIAWVFDAPADRWSVLDLATGGTFVYRAPVGFTASWWRALAASDLLRLEWWLREYALPGSVYSAFLEYPTEPVIPPPPPGGNSLYDGFEAWP